jgi:DNA-binding response OmpR family regulator
MFKIYIVEDDENLSTMVKSYLQKYNYKVFEVNNFRNIEKEFEDYKPDLVLLDINLPYYDGFHICKYIRQRSNVPIIIISARNNETEQILGIELGADDYVVKPFNIEYLYVKIKAAFRRVYGEYNQEAQSTIAINGIFLDENTFKLSYKNIDIELSKNEFKLVKKLMENKDKFVTREDLLCELWDADTFVDDNTLSVNVSRLKTKFSELGIEGIIKTKRRTGYMLDSSVLGDKSC